MAFSVQMPALGESVSEGTVTRWLKQEGEQVEVDEPLLEVSTDKVDTEIPSPAAGVLERIVVPADETVAVGAELALIGDGSAGGQGGGGEQEQGQQPQGGGEGAGQAQQAQQAQQSEQPEMQAQSAVDDQLAEQQQAPEQRQEQPEPLREEQGSAGGSDGRQQQSGGSAGGSGGSGGGTPVEMPALGESVSEGTVTRWLKSVGDTVEVDEPLLEVSTDKVDTEIPSPVAGTLLEITVGADETVPVGAQLALVGSGSAGPSDGDSAQAQGGQAPGAQDEDGQAQDPQAQDAQAQGGQDAPAAQASKPSPFQPAPSPQSFQQADSGQGQSSQGQSGQAPSAPASTGPQPQAQPAQGEASPQQPAAQQPAPQPSPAPGGAENGQDAGNGSQPDGDSSAYVTPLVRKLASEHGVDLSSLTGTGVGGRIRKQDVLDAAKAAKDAETAKTSEAQPVPVTSPASTAPSPGNPAAVEGAPAPVVSPLRGTTEKMSRLRKVIAQRMTESLQTSAQLTTVVEVDVTRIARLRDRAKRDFEAREGVKLSFLPFFAKATVEALKQFPQLNASIDTTKGEITYFDAEHLGIAVDTDRGLLVPVIKDAGDLNIAGLSRKISDLALRTRSNKVTPDELGGGTFTLTNTGSRGALFDTPIINQPQVGILGTGAVVKRPVVLDYPQNGEVIAIRSMVYLALTYDHRLVDGADAARFLSAVKARLEEAAFEADLGL